MASSIIDGDPTVSEIMSKDIVVVGVDESLDVAYRLLEENNFRHLPVVNSDGDLVGVVSDKDLLRMFVGELNLVNEGEDRGQNYRERSVREAMSAEPETVYEDDSVSQASSALLENKFDCLPVLRSQKLVGILTTADILREAAAK